ncbi:MAG: prephenate dehydratase [Dehalococcoidia bacterium]|nr:prephenate dehydratase [Dehalococcoidia bacterium]
MAENSVGSVVRLAHLGPRGTYTEAAALAYDPHARLLPLPTVAAAMQAVLDGQSEGAVCAIENSIEGGVLETLDLMLRDEFSLRICAEVVLPIRHALVGAPGIDPAAASIVYSHPQALAQCRQHLRVLAPRAEPVAALSTAAAIAAAVAAPGTVAVGSAFAAQLNAATVYADDIGDESGNQTRFVVMAPEDHAPTGDDKTSIAFTTHHDRPGSLVDMLGRLSQRQINMTHIESRPTRRQLGTYVFLVDFAGHRADPPVAAVLAELRASALWLRVFGSYQRWAREHA